MITIVNESGIVIIEKPSDEMKQLIRFLKYNEFLQEEVQIIETSASDTLVI